VAGERAVVIAEDAREKLERLSWRTWIATHQIKRHPRCCNERGQLLARRPQREDIRSDLIELQCGYPASPSLVPPACGQPSYIKRRSARYPKGRVGCVYLVLRLGHACRP
jgi:hypothetical protein